MARIDTLLQAMLGNRMDALVLRPGRLPALRRGETEHEVTRTPLSDEVIAGLLTEIAPEGALGEPVVGARWAFDYELEGRQVRFSGREGDGGWSATARLAPAAAASAPAAAAPAAGPAAGTGTDAGPGPEAGGDRELPAIEELLRLMVERGASDLHLSAGQTPRLRLDGDLEALAEYRPPSSDALRDRLFVVTPERNQEEFDRTNDTDFAFAIPGVARFRVNLFRNRLGVCAVFRQIPEKIPTPDEIGLPEAVRKLAYLSKGLVLVTGPTGSGKSTTLAALVNLVNSVRRDHIITVEDPIEFVHASRKCLVNQREVGVHTDSFKRALRAALREDPDIVMVGEMRDLETVSIAIETAETGHLVFGTLHTTTAPSTVERLVDQFPGDRQEQIRLMLADSLKAVIAQTLLRRIGGGRVAAFEILICTSAVSNLIREGKTFQIASAMQTGRGLGMVTLNDSLIRLVEQKIVEPREAYINAVDKGGFTKKLEAGGFKLDLDEPAAAGPEA